MEPNPPGGSGPRPNSNHQGVSEEMVQQMMQRMREQMEREFEERENKLEEKFRKEMDSKEKAVVGMLKGKPST